MKIDRTRLRKGTSEIPAECHALIERLRQCSRPALLEELSKISTWTFGKCELYHWIGVLDVFDSILEEATQSAPALKWALNCDTSYDASEKKLLLWTLHFTTLLIEHSFSRHLYNSMEHLLTLMSSSDMNVVLAVLNLLYMFSKRSNFITRLANEKRQALLSRLHYLAESWGGKENGFGLADCCIPIRPIPHSATTLHFEFHKDHSMDKESKELKDAKLKKSSSYIHIENVDKLNKTPAEIMKGLVHLYFIPPDKEMWLFTHVRLAHHFAEYKTRLLCVQARLQALSVLVYSNALQDSAHTLLYNGFLEELVELIELDNPEMVDIRSAALRTLTSIIHLDRNPHFPKKSGSRLASIIDVTGANQYHGFLPTLVRHCITSLTRQTIVKSEPLTSTSSCEDDKLPTVNLPLTSGDLCTKFPLPLATALFSFLYHLASYEAGGEALVSCGMMESLLQVINWNGVELEHITFVTRAVRVIDLITNVDMQVFHNHGGLQSFINRLDVGLCLKLLSSNILYLQVEVQLCRPEQTYEFKPVASIDLTISDVDEDFISNYECQSNTANLGKTCLPQRAALLKSMLNFLKKALQDTMFSDNVRHVMEGILPSALKHIIANAEYYGPSLFLLATDLVTVYVFQEPTLLSTLQDNGLTDVILHALLIKDVPATREVLGSLPNVFSALCLNARGLQSFVKCKPFDRLFKVLVSPHYLSAMRRRRSSDPIGDTASNLGNAMDELMRHQPSLKADAIAAIVKLLHELCQLGTDSKYICWRPHSKSDSSPVTVRTPINNEGSSDEEDDDEEEASTSSHNAQNDSQESSANGANEKTPIALVDYILNIMKFIDAILSNNSTDDHCREFVNQRGLQPLLKILGLPNLPVDCPVTISAQAVASVCKSILNLAHEPLVLKYGLVQLNDVLQRLKPLYSDLDTSSSSRLLHELAHAPHLETAFNNANATPLLHAMAAAHGYVLMFVHVCRTGQSEIRTLSLQHWGSEPGLAVLKNLAELYTSLVWESTLLLALCSDDAIPVDCDFGREDMERLNIPVFDRADCSYTSSSDSTANVASALEGLSTNPTQIHTMDIDGEQITSKPTSQQLKYIKPLLGASSRLGRALAELFGLLVKLCVGTPVRQRRGQNIVSTPLFPTPHARAVATALNYLLANGLNSAKLPQSPVPKFKLTFLICSVGFTSPMLFDEKRYPYHLMLQKFVSLGGQTTFFNTFKWALSAGNTIELSEGLEHPDLPEGTGEFLDAWLMLLEKMVNPKAILDSPHSLTNRSGSTSAAARKLLAFSPLRYLIQIHKLAFEAIMFMWGKKPLPTYGVRMSESMLSILRHILRGEKIIKERLAKGDDKATPSNGSRAESDVNQENLRQLMDMGFSRDHALEALIHTLNVEQATDYLLSNPTNRAGTSGMDSDFTEDDQVIQAIALSLGEPGPSSEKKKEDSEEDIIPLSEALINHFTKGALQICLELIEAIPETVYKVCELLGTIMKRNGPAFREELLDKLLTTIKFNSMRIYYRYKYRPAVLEVHLELCESRDSLCLGYLIHLFALFFEIPSFIDMRIPCGLAVHRGKLVPEFFNLLLLGERMMQHGAVSTKEPRWLTPLLLLLDSLAKVGVCTFRKRKMHAATNRVWRWYDLVTGKWTPYSSINNKLINDAYWNGEQSIRVTCGRRRYTITFGVMLQCNDETGNNRPISMTPLSLEHEDMFTDTLGEGDECATFEIILPESESRRCLPVPLIADRLSADIVQTIVRMLHYPIEKDLVHAIMRLCLRLTRDYDTAKTFANGGGIRALLRMRQTSSFNGYSSLATILIRHSLEEPQTLAHSLEKVIRGRTMPSIPPPYRELVYLTRQIGSAVSRAPDTFYEVAKSILRVDCSIFRRPDDVDSRLPMRTEPTTRTHAPQMEEESSIRVIYDLLHALLKPLEWSVPDHIVEVQSPKPCNTSTATRETMYQRASDLLTNTTSSNDILNMEAQDDSSVAPIMLVHVTRSPGEAAVDNRVEQELVTRPMIAKHSILKILADAVVSYGAVAKLITDFTYKSGDADIITEDCSALAFMFDKLLPVIENISDRDCSMMCRVLIAAISSCNHCPEAQSTLVNEVKSALVRALLMPECFEKHSQIQLITGIITTMIENCPPSNQLRVFKNQPMNGQINNIVKLMLRKGIFNDLARISHYMDLSSPHFPLTVNSSLKPMESLSRIVNQPITGTSSNRMNKKLQQHNLDDNGATQSGTTSTEATNAQGEETIEDTENTEHDISAVASSLEANPEVTVAHEADNVLEHLMDQLLERSNNDSNRTYTEVASGRNHHAMDIDDDGNLGFDHEPDATEELMSTDSGDSDSNASDQEVEDDENDDDEDEGENIEITYEDEDDDVNNEVSNADREEDILMIQYADHELDEALPRMVRWNENGFAVPLFDDLNHTNEQTAPTSHPLLVSRHNSENGSAAATRTQRTNRARRYQYLQLNSRNSNPPVILHRYFSLFFLALVFQLSYFRLLGPVAQNLSLSTNEIMGSPNSRDTARVVVMDNFGLIPTNEEQIDFVDPSGYLFGPSLAATLSHVPSVLHWWNEESKLLDPESNDITMYVCNKLIPFLITWRNKELIEHKKKKEEEEKAKKKTIEEPEGHESDVEIIEPRSESNSTNDVEIIENTEQNDPLQSSERGGFEVISVLEQYRMLHSQHNRPSSSGTAVDEPAGASASSEVNPEFLAALPPALQEEVLSQQRLEQQRHAAAHANPDEPVDAGAFFETLQPSLRTMILSDMEDSQMSALPPDLAAEAQTLRRDWEARNRQIVQERIFQSNLTTIIRHSTRGRLSSRLNTHLLPQRAQWGTWGRAELFPPVPSTSQGMRMRGRQLLDHESLSCLLVLIFANDPKLNTLRLHRVIRNLCYHSPTREWIIKALLSIIDKSVQIKPEDSSVRPTRRTPKPGPLTSKLITDLKNVGNGANWLNIRMEAALGCHANVFMINRASGKRSDRLNGSSIIIHPQAGPIVCKNALDLFISLSKNFPSCLLPLRIREDKEEREERAKNMLVLSPSKYKIEGTDFWDMLLKLDSTSSKKGKSLAKTHSNFSLSNDVESICFGFEQSPFGQLLCMLSSSVIYRSTQLTDKLLRLLSVITAGMPELGKATITDTPGKSKAPIYESVSAPESALSLAVNVLTYKSCSEEGLEDATTLLLNLANCSVDMRYVILKLLLHGALRIGEVVREQIHCMLHELRKLNKVQKRKVHEEPSPSSSKGTMQNRFTKETVIIIASTKVKAGYDLQLPCMAPLTSKTSSQLFFLRVLRVIVQIREAIKNGLQKGDCTLQFFHLSALSDQLSDLETLWETLSLCLLELEHTPDDHAVLVLQPAVEAFFLVYSPQQGATDREANKPQNVVQETETLTQSIPSGSESESVATVEGSVKSSVPPDQLKFISFAEKHRTVLNQILRQTTAHLTDGPFSVLVDHTKVLDFDVKRKYFRTELERLDQGLRREETAIHVRRSHVFEDSFRELYRRSPEEWKNRFYIVFEEEEGQDAGGLLREWYMIISRDIFNPMYALFTTSPGDRVTYMINPASHYNPNHLCYFKFVGRVIAKAIYDNKLLECYFTRSFYKHILGISVKYTDMESEDYSFYRGLVYLMEYHVNDLGYDLTFSTEINEFGVTETRDLIPDGRNVPVTEENKMEYVRLSCQMKMTGAIRQQLNAFLEGFYDIIPKRLISIFNEQELELLISGLPNVDIDDLKANTEYHKYQSNSLQIQWFWRALRSFDQADRAKFLQFVTGTSKVPLQGFAHLEGMNGVQKFQVHRDDRSTDRLPSAHTCFNQLDLPVYETSEKLRTYLQKAIHECSEGFGFA
ncbi:hypothetical protein RI129_012084 [Pyrocoelia pectoralis]|uniref:E3 ubiquitin-protein ligase HUWE1 n=1 Tax=Pyrocoelia pectoralis TaxID=417401 RepID=A0AAN7ZEA4_9COLE